MKSEWPSRCVVEGINGARLRHLRRQEQWTQTDLANRLGVHRATLARWEAGDGDPPYEVADQMAKLFKVPPGYFFEIAPVPDNEGENPDGVILDPVLKRFPLAKLQKFTRPALRALGLSLTQLARKLPTLPLQRIQELLEGQKPTAYEIQLLRSNLGPDFHPTSSIRTVSWPQASTRSLPQNNGMLSNIASPEWNSPWRRSPSFKRGFFNRWLSFWNASPRCSRRKSCPL